MTYQRFERDNLILRDELALDRTRLANERTLLSYIRTAIMLIVTGATAFKILAMNYITITLGSGLIGLGILVTTLGAWRFVRTRRALLPLTDRNP